MSLPDGVRDFVQGLFRPSLTAVCTAAATLAAIVVAYALTFTPSFMASDLYRYLLIDGQDSSTVVTHRVFAAPRDGQPSILYFGDSAGARCIESEDGLADLVRRRTGQTFHVHDFASGAQSTWVVAAVAEQVPPGPGGVVVLAITPEMLGIGSRSARRMSLQAMLRSPIVGVTSPAIADEARRAGLTPPTVSGIYAFDEAGFILPHRKALLHNVLYGPPDIDDPLNAPWYARAGTAESNAQQRRSLPLVARQYDESAFENFGVMERTIARARQAGPVHVVIMMAPMNPGWNDDAAGRAYFARFRADLEGFARKVDGTFASATDVADLRQSDFVDFEGHLNNAAARKRCVEGLADTIRAAIGSHP